MHFHYNVCLGTKGGKECEFIMRVVHLLNTGKYSGAEHVVIKIMSEFKKYSDIESIYISLDGEIKQFLDSNDLDYYLVEKMNIKTLKKIVKFFKPDIIHAHDYTMSILASACFSKAKIISHLHNNSPWIKQRGIYSYVYLLSTFRYNKIITISKAIEREYIFSHYIYKKIQCMSNPLDTKEILNKSNLGENEYAYDLIFLGRITEAKNPYLMANIINLLCRKIKNISIVVVGDGELMNDFKAAIEVCNDSFVTFTGFLENPYPILKRSKMLCMPSKWEGFGLTAFEALTLGVPVVCSGAGGLSDIVDNSCGAICYDDLDKYVEEIQELLTNKECFLRKQNAALEKSKNIENIDTYIENMYIMYKKISKGRK